MSITILKEGSTIYLVRTDQTLPDGEPIVLFTEAEVAQCNAQAWLDLQLPAFLRRDEAEIAEDLF